MATDDERRRVAARLRMSDERDAAGFVDCLLAEVVRGREFCETPCEECHARLLGELADLIEPSCDRDALLALADEIHGLVENQEIRFFHVVQVHESTLATIEARIRKALGVDDKA